MKLSEALMSRSPSHTASDTNELVQVTAGLCPSPASGPGRLKVLFTNIIFPDLHEYVQILWDLKLKKFGRLC